MDASVADGQDNGLFRALLTGIYSAYDGYIPEAEDIRTVLSAMEVKPETLDRKQAETLGWVLGGLLSGSVVRTSGDLLSLNETSGGNLGKTSISGLVPTGTIASLLSGVIAGVLRPQTGSHDGNGCQFLYPPIGYPIYTSGYPQTYPGYYPSGYPVMSGYYPVIPAGSQPPYPTSGYPGGYPSFPGYYPAFPGGSYRPEAAAGSGHYTGNHPVHPVHPVHSVHPVYRPPTSSPPPPMSGSTPVAGSGHSGSQSGYPGYKPMGPSVPLPLRPTPQPSTTEEAVTGADYEAVADAI